MVWRWDGVAVSPEPRWSWGPEVEVARVTAPRLAPELRVLLEAGTTLSVTRRLEHQGPRERWDDVFREALEVAPWRSRELAKLLLPGGRVPVRPLRNEADVLRFLQDVGLGEPKVSRWRERTAIVAPGVVARQLLGSTNEASSLGLSLEGGDPEALARAARALTERA